MTEDIWLLAIGVCVLASGLDAQGVRARSRLRPAAPQDYYTAEDAEAEDRAAGDQVVLVSDDAYRVYRARADQRLDDEQEVYRPRVQPSPRKEAPRQPPVQTIRNYNKVNDDGSFTFGYEAADGSFKEETRGTDCVVRGKYGYVDPDGNKREFSYVSGNPCDPNAPNDDEEPDREAPGSAELDDDGVANYPSAPRPRPVTTYVRPTTTARPTTTYFQTDFGGEEEQEEPLQQVRQRIVQRPRPAPVQLAITPRPQPASTPRALPPPTTFRPQLLAVPVPTPAAPRLHFPSSTPPQQIHNSPRPTSQSQTAIDFVAEFAKFQQENPPRPTHVSPSPSPAAAASPRPGQLYSTELVFDPSSGQYNTQLFQALPQTKGELNLNQRLQSFVAQPQPRPFVPSQPAPAPLFRHQIEHAAPLRQSAGQDAYQRQQAEQQFVSSAQLFQQQQQLQHSQLQRDRAAARQQAQRLAASAPVRQQQPLYYVQQQQQPGGGGQIDSFLRTHGIQF